MAGEARAQLARRAVSVLLTLIALNHRLFFLLLLVFQTQFTKTRAGTHSDRFLLGMRPTLIQDAKILPGARNGVEIIFEDGNVIAVGYIPYPLMMQAKHLPHMQGGGMGLAVDLDMLIRMRASEGRVREFC
ncbi:hypothetical protein R3P38DRAFT_2807253 [Favolaschia claudopus]|uniref:Uncharacterized protein n=1 Tax=Favolaschia claudopus TaxID=2862362 RepID=A0AAV9ZI59_9AGAR